MYPGKNGIDWWQYKGLRDRKQREEDEIKRLKKAAKDKSPKIRKPKEPPNEGEKAK